MMTMKSKMRVTDMSALAKTFGLLLLSVMFIVTYGSEMVVCNGDTVTGITENISVDDLTDITSSSCRMNLYHFLAPPQTGHVKLWYYLLIWSVILLLSVLGFFVLCCNCSHTMTRIYAFALFLAAGALGFAEVVSIIEGYKLWKSGEAIFGIAVERDNWKELAATFNGLNSCVMIMEVYILLNTAWDAWNAKTVDVNVNNGMTV